MIGLRRLGCHPYLVAAVVMGALVALFFAPVIRRNATFSAVENLQRYSYPWVDASAAGGGQLYPQVDQADFVHPRQVLLDRSLKVDGQLPLWDPTTFGGHPFFAGTGSRLAYPPLLLLSLVFSPSWTHDLYVALHLVAAGLAVFALMREFRVGREGALLAGVAWAFGSYTLGWIMLEMFAAPAVFLPLALLCARRWYDRGSAGSLLAGALMLGLLFLGTSVENALFSFLCVGVYIVCLAMARLRQRWSTLTTAGRLAVGGGPALFMLGAAAVAAVGILPFLELSRTSERAATAHFTRAASEVPLSSFRYLLTPPPVLSDIFQATLVLIRSQVFMGSAAALLATVGFFRRRAGGGLGRGLVILLFLFTIGTPMTSLALRVVPQLDALNGFGRSLFLFDLGVAVLAGLGLDALINVLRTRSQQGRDDGRGGRGRAVVPGLVTVVLVGLTAAQLLSYGRRVNPPFETRSGLFPSTPATDAVHALIGDGPGRSPIVPASHFGGLPVFVGTSAMAVDVPTVSGYEPVVPATASRLWRVVGGESVESVLATPIKGTFVLDFNTKGLRSDLLGRTGVAAVMGPPDINADPGWNLDNLAARGLRQTYAGPDGTLLEVLGHRPRAAVVPQAAWVSSPAEALELFTSASFDASREVVLEGRRGAPGNGGEGRADPVAGRGDVAWRTDSPNSLSLDVVSDEPGWLVLLDGWDPGWHATVNGRSVDVRRADYNFRAVAVPAGASTVHFTYRPTSVLVGAAISVASTALIAAVLVTTTVRRRRARRRSGGASRWRRRPAAGASP